MKTPNGLRCTARLLRAADPMTRFMKSYRMGAQINAGIDKKSIILIKLHLAIPKLVGAGLHGRYGRWSRVGVVHPTNHLFLVNAPGLLGEATYEPLEKPYVIFGDFLSNHVRS